MTFAALAGRVGDTFTVRTDPEVLLTLAGAEPDATQPDTAERGGSLIFRGSNDWVLPQGTYALAHAELGERQLALAPVGRDADGMEYEAVLG